MRSVLAVGHALTDVFILNQIGNYWNWIDSPLSLGASERHKRLAIILGQWAFWI